MPTFYHGSKARLYVNGRDWSTYARSIKGTLNVDTAEVSTLGEIAKKYVPGMQDATFSVDGIFDGAASRIDTMINDCLSASEPNFATWVINYDLLGRVAYGMEMTESNYEVSAGMGDAATFTLAGQSAGSGGLERCMVLWPSGSFTAAASGVSGSGAQWAASNAYGGVLFIQALSQSGSVRWELEHSGSNANYTTILSGSFGSTASGASRFSCSGNVGTWTRFSCSPVSSCFANVHAAFGRKYFAV